MTGSSTFRRSALGELAEIFDGPHATPAKTDSGPVFLGISCLAHGRLDLTDSEHVSEEDFAAWTRRVTPLPGDVVFSYETRLGEAAIVPAGLRCCLGRRMGLLRARPGEVDPRFLLYAYLAPEFQETLRARTIHGSTVDRIPLIEMPRFPICVPRSVDEQRAIASLLAALDDKIDLNRRMNETLEELARTIFKSWFVDFDPVRAKAEGRQPVGMDAETAAVFPCRLIGDVPEGWAVSTLGEVARQRRDAVMPNEIPPETPYIGLEHMPKKSIALSEWGSAGEAESQKSRFDTGDILFGKLRPYFHKVGVAPVSGVCSTDIVVVQPTNPSLFGLALGHLSSEAFVAHTNAGSDGTKMPRTNWSWMASYKIVRPAEGPSTLFANLFRTCVSRIRAAIFESRTLSETRDLLLPKLISGELRIQDAEKMAEAAL